MKKLSYLFLTLALAVSVNSCDNDKSNDGPMPKPKNTVVVISTALADEQTPTLTEMARVTYPLFTNEEGAKVEGFTYSYKEENGTQKDVTFAVTHSATECVVKFFDKENSEIKVTYKLNAAGNPNTASATYVSDNTIFTHYSFSYDDSGMLTRIVEDASLEPEEWKTWYSATYENSELKTIISLGAENTVTTGPMLNNFGLDPMCFFSFFGASPIESPAVLAAFCNLLPHTKHIPSQYSNPDTQLDAVVTTVENGQLKGFSVLPIVDVKFLYN